jgi:PAS domain S-box-containing protein
MGPGSNLPWIEQLLQEREALKESHARAMAATIEKYEQHLRSLRALVESLEAAMIDMAEAVVCVDAYGSIQFFNRAAESLFGYRPYDVLGRAISVLMVPNGGGQFLVDTIAELASGAARPILRRVYGRRQTAAVFPMEVRVWAGEDPIGRTMVLLLKQTPGDPS